MNGGEAQRARLLDASMADLHEQLGAALGRAVGIGGVIHANGHKHKASDRSPFRDIPMVASVDMATVDRIAAESAAFLATLTPERRAQLEREWSEK